MMRGKVKAIRKGCIDPTQFQTRRTLDVDIKDLEVLIKSCIPRVIEKIADTPPPSHKVADDGTKAAPASAAPPTRKVTDDGTKAAPVIPPLESKKENKDKVDLSQPTKGEDGQLCWGTDAVFPPVFVNLFDQIRAMYNIKKEVIGFSVMLWTPRVSYKTSKKNTINNIPTASMSVASRIILSAGHREHFDISASHGKLNGEGDFNLGTNESVSIPIGVAAGLQISFDNSDYYVIKTREGHRPRHIAKDPSKTFIIVIDGCINAESLVNQIKVEAAKLTDGDEAASNKLQEKAAAIFMPIRAELTPVDMVAAAAASKTQESTTISTNVQNSDESSAVDAVVAAASCKYEPSSEVPILTPAPQQLEPVTVSVKSNEVKISDVIDKKSNATQRRKERRAKQRTQTKT